MKSISKRIQLILLIIVFMITFHTNSFAITKQTTISFDSVYSYLNKEFGLFRSNIAQNDIDYVAVQDGYIDSLQIRIDECKDSKKKQKLLEILKTANIKLSDYESNAKKIAYFEDQISRTTNQLDKAKYTNQLDGIKNELRKQFVDYAFLKVECDLLTKDCIVGEIPDSLMKNNKYTNINTYSSIQLAALNLAKVQYKAYVEITANDDYLVYLEGKFSAATDEAEKTSWSHQIDEYKSKQGKSQLIKSIDNKINELAITKLSKGKTVTEKNQYNNTFQNAIKEVTISVFEYYFGFDFDKSIYEDSMKLVK